MEMLIKKPSRTSPKDPISTSWGCLDLTSWERLKLTSRESPNLTSKELPWGINSGCPQDILKTYPRRPSNHVLGTMWGPSVGGP